MPPLVPAASLAMAVAAAGVALAATRTTPVTRQTLARPVAGTRFLWPPPASKAGGGGRWVEQFQEQFLSVP